MRALAISFLLAATGLVCSTDAMAIMPERVMAANFEGGELPGDTCAAEDLTESEHLAALHPAIVDSIEEACVAPFEVPEWGFQLCDTHACAGGAVGCPVTRWNTQTPYIGHDFADQRIYSRERIHAQSTLDAGFLGTCTIDVSSDHRLELFYAQSRAGLEGVRFDAFDHVASSDSLLDYYGCNMLSFSLRSTVAIALFERIEATLAATAASALADVAIPAVVCPITQ